MTIHTVVNIAWHVPTIVEEFGLTKNDFYVTLDNASAMVILKPKFNGYIDVLPKDDNHDNILLHQRCACHIINIIFKFHLKSLKPYIEEFWI